MKCAKCFREHNAQDGNCPYCGYSEKDNPSEPQYLTPETILASRYRIGAVIGSGGFGVTYAAWDQTLEMRVAIKEFLPGEFSTRIPGQTAVTVYGGEKTEQFETGRNKFIDESRRLAKLQNVPGIVQIYNSFEENGTSYIVMEYLEGETLDQKLKRERRIPEQEAIKIMLPVLQSLETVHKQGLLHRDIAPNNIFLTKEGEAKLLDFGASRSATGSHSKSLTVLYKEGYTAEEQYQSHGNQGPWTDVYAAAATLYKMLTGITPPGALERRRKDTLKEPSRLGVKVSRSVENALMNALNVDIKKRTQSAWKFVEELQAEKVQKRYARTEEKELGKIPLQMKVGSGIVAVAMTVFLILLYSGILTRSLSAFSRFGIPDEMTRVPNLVNCELEDAQKETEEADLQFLIVDKQFSTQIPENRVLRQELKAGDVIERNTELHVVVSAGVETMTPEEMEMDGIEIVTIPDVQYQERDEAMALLLEAGLKVEILYETTGIVEEGRIIRQSVTAGEQLVKGEKITLTVEDFVVDWTNASIFEQEIRKQLEKETEEIYASDLLKIERLADVAVDFQTTYDMSPLSNCLHLQTLRISAPYGNDAHDGNIHLDHLEKLRNLTELNVFYLYGVNVDDISWMDLMTNMEGMYLSYTDVRDVQVLQNMPELTHLSIHNTPIDKLPDELSLSTLEYLEIDEWQLNNTKRIDRLSSLTNMSVFDLRGTATDQITMVNSLVSLDLYLDDLSVDLQFLQNMENLKRLELSFSSGGSKLEEAVESGSLNLDVLEKMNQLEELAILNISFIDAPNAEAYIMGKVGKMDQLRTLSIYLTNIMPYGQNVVDFNYISGLKNLESLSLYGVENETSDGIEALTGLQDLDIHNCEGLGPEDFEGLTQLEKLYIDNVDKTDELKALQNL